VKEKNVGLSTSVPSATGSPSEKPFSILFLGDATRAEFREARAYLEKWGIVTEVADTDSAAAALAEDGMSPDVIVVAQAFPGQFSHQATDRLRRLAPLARVLGLMGSCCEGEMRSGSPWPATVRVYWHQWPARCHRQFRRLASGQSCSWALPLTATEEERLLADAAECSAKEGPHPNPLPKGEGTELVAIRSQSREMADWLSAACRSREFVTICQRDSAFARVEGATAGVFDGTDLADDECDALRRFVIAVRPAPVIALLSFPRIEDHARALSAGAAVVLSKPLMMEDLFEAIDG
jgi:CheY-like chemotaxis protein